jgi:excisionase family DNA binding protein
MTDHLLKPNPLQFYTPKEVACFLKVSVKSVRRKIKCGEIRAKKIGRLDRVSEPDLVDYVNRLGGSS